MRTLTDHITNPCNGAIAITVPDSPGSGGANHIYDVAILVAADLPKDDPACIQRRVPHANSVRLNFQNGPMNESGPNGITQEALLAIVIDRLRSFQAGPFACRENALALTKCEEALHWLHHRTLARMRRGVEGTHAK